MTDLIDFAAVFARLAGEGRTEETVSAGGVRVRMVHVAGAAAGRWDVHPHTAETAVVWSGDFTVAFRDRTLSLTAGQCCVIPAGTDHRGTSAAGAEVILLTHGA